MCRNRVVLVLAAVAATAAIAAAAQAAVAPPPQPDAVVPQSAPKAALKPALRVVRAEHPLLIRGLYFKAGERVRVTGTVVETKVARTLLSTASGTFTLNLGDDVSLAGCSGGASLKAVGTLGSVAILKIPPKMCAVVRTP
jgi:hypothetical protein